MYDVRQYKYPALQVREETLQGAARLFLIKWGFL